MADQTTTLAIALEVQQLNSQAKQAISNILGIDAAMLKVVSSSTAIDAKLKAVSGVLRQNISVGKDLVTVYEKAKETTTGFGFGLKTVAGEVKVLSQKILENKKAVEAHQKAMTVAHGKALEDNKKLITGREKRFQASKRNADKIVAQWRKEQKAIIDVKHAQALVINAERQRARIQKQNQSAAFHVAERKYGREVANTSRKLKEATFDEKRLARLKRETQQAAYWKAQRKYQTELKKTAEAAKGVTLSWQSMVRLFAVQVTHRMLSSALQLLTQSVREAVQLQIAIGEIQTIDTSNSPFEQWRKTIEDLSAGSGIAFADEAESAYQALSNQIVQSAKDYEQFGRVVNTFAITAATNSATATNLLTAALNSFNLKANETHSTAAKLFKIIELGRIRATDMEGSFGRIGVFANQLGISLDELGASLTVITRSGVQFSEAMTFLRNMMQKLIRPTKAMKEFFKELGVASGQAARQTFGWGGFLEKIEEKAHGSAAAIGELFGRIRATSGAMIFTGERLQAYGDDLEQITKATETYGAAHDKIMKTAGKTVEIEMNKIRLYFQRIGSTFIDTISVVLVQSGALKIALITIGDLFLLSLLPATVLLTKAIWGLVASMSALQWKVVIVIGAIEAILWVLRAFAYATEKEFKKSMEAIKDHAEDVDRFFVVTSNSIKDSLDKITQAFRQLAATDISSLNEQINDLQTAFEDAENTLEESITNTTDAIRDQLTEIKNLVREIESEFKSLERAKEVLQTRAAKDLLKSQLSKTSKDDFAGREVILDAARKKADAQAATAKTASEIKRAQALVSNIEGQRAANQKRARDTVVRREKASAAKDKAIIVAQEAFARRKASRIATRAEQDTARGSDIGGIDFTGKSERQDIKRVRQRAEQDAADAAAEKKLDNRVKAYLAEVDAIDKINDFLKQSRDTEQERLDILDEQNKKLDAQIKIKEAEKVIAEAKEDQQQAEQDELDKAKRRAGKFDEDDITDAKSENEILKVAKKQVEELDAIFQIQNRRGEDTSEIEDEIERVIALAEAHNENLKILKEQVDTQEEIKRIETERKELLLEVSEANKKDQAAREAITEILHKGIGFAGPVGGAPRKELLNLLQNIKDQNFEEGLGKGVTTAQAKDAITAVIARIAGSFKGKKTTEKIHELNSVKQLVELRQLISGLAGAKGINDISSGARLADLNTQLKDAYIEANQVVEANTRETADTLNLIKQILEDVQGKTKAMGGAIAMGRSIGTDTVSAMLTPGEFVVNKASAEKFFPQLLAMNGSQSQSFAGGGPVNNLNVGGITVNESVSPQVTADTIVQQIQRGQRQGRYSI